MTALIQAAQRTKDTNEYYFSVKLREIARMQKEGIDVINLGIGSPDLPPHPQVVEALHRSALQPGHHGYQSYKGTDALRKAFSDWYANFFQLDLSPENEILPLMGSKEGIMHISMAFLNPGDEVLIPNPGYPAYAAVTNMLGANPVYYDLDASNGYYPDLRELEKSNLSKVRLMWINYPHMPTGTNGSMELFEALVAFARRHHILLVNDNPYAFVLNKKPMSMLSVSGSREVALELNSLSKSHNMPGWRIGMVAGNAAYIAEILKMKSNMDSGMFLPMQDAAVVALSLGRDWYDAQNAVYASRKAHALAIFDALGCQYAPDQVGLFVWGRVGQSRGSARAIADDLLLRSAVFITPGFIFGSKGDDYLRISLCSPDAVFAEALRRIQSKEIRFV